MAEKEKMQNEFNILLSIYCGLSIIIILITTYSLNYLIINLIEAVGDSTVYKQIIKVTNQFTKKHNLLLWNSILYFPIIPIINLIIYDKIDFKKIITIKKKLVLKITILTIVIISGYLYKKVVIKNEVPMLYLILRDGFLIGFSLIMLWWVFWLTTLFFNNSQPKLSEKLSKKEIFDLYKDNLSKTPKSKKDVIVWKTHYKRRFLKMFNSRRGVLLIGGAGSGKSYSVIEPIIGKAIDEGQVIFNYDVKFSTLTEVAYNAYLKSKEQNPHDPRTFATIYPNDIRYSNRLNCFDPNITNTEAQSREAVTTVLYNLNKSWTEKSGDFFVDSAIAYMVGIAWYLNIRQRETGQEISTLPHIIEIVTNPNAKMGLEVLLSHPEIQTIMTSIYTGYAEGATDQLAGQMASLQTALAQISDKSIYYIASKSDIHSDINNYDHPTILNLGGAIKTQKAYAPIISLYASTIKQMINEKNRIPMWYLLDEAPTLFIENLQELPNTGRSNGISTLVGLQSRAQLMLGYGDKAGGVLKASFGNLIVGQIQEKDLSQEIQDLMGEQKIETISKSKDHKGKFSTSYNKEWKKLIDLEFLKNLQPGEFVGSLSDTEENILKTGSVKTSNFAVKLNIDPPEKRFEKLPYFNKELIAIFQEEIRATPKNIISEYFKVHKILKILNKNEEDKRANIDLEKINFYIIDKSKTSKERFIKIFNGEYTYKNEIIKEENIIAQKRGTKTNTETYKTFIQKTLELEIPKRKNTIVTYYKKHINELKADLTEDELKNHELKDYLLHFIKKNYKEKEEQRIMERVLSDNYKKIKEATSDFMLTEFTMIELKKHLKNELFKDKDSAYEELEANFKEIASAEQIQLWIEETATIDNDLLKMAFKIYDTNQATLSQKIYENRKVFDKEEKKEIDLDQFIIDMPQKCYEKTIRIFKRKYESILNSKEGKIEFSKVNEEFISAIRNFPISILAGLDSYYLKTKL